MSINFGSKNDYKLKEAGTEHRYLNAASAAYRMSERASAPKREQRGDGRIPFSGLITNRILSSLPGQEFVRLLPHFEPVSLSPGKDLYKPEGDVHFIYFPETAVISQLYIFTDGSMTEAAMIGREGLVGLSAIFNAQQPSYLTQVTIAGSCLRIRTEVLKEEFSRGGALQNLLLSYAGKRIAHLSQRAACNRHHSVQGRLSSWLLMIHDRVGDDRLPLTHDQIAHHLGVRRAGVTNAANALKNQGIVSYTRGHIQIQDLNGLEMSACECYRIVRLAGEAKGMRSAG